MSTQRVSRAPWRDSWAWFSGPECYAMAVASLGNDLLAAIDAAGQTEPPAPAPAIRSAHVTATPPAANRVQTTAAPPPPPPAGPYVPPFRRPGAVQAAWASAPPFVPQGAAEPAVASAEANRGLNACRCCPPGLGHVSLQQRRQNISKLSRQGSASSLDPLTRVDSAGPSVPRRPKTPARGSGVQSWGRLAGLHGAPVTCPCGGHRKDIAGLPQPLKLLGEVKELHLCNDHHLLGGCPRGNECSSRHLEEGLSQDQWWALLCVARQRVCRRGEHCNVVGCVYGHHCTYRNGHGDCRYGGSVERRGRCVFTDAMHCPH